MKKGDVVLISFPFTDLSNAKVRPALVISNESYNVCQDDIVLLLITSKVDNIHTDDYLLKSDNPEFTDTGLKQSSVFRTSKIQTLKKTLLMRNLGVVGTSTLSEIDNRLRKFLEL